MAQKEALGAWPEYQKQQEEQHKQEIARKEAIKQQKLKEVIEEKYAQTYGEKISFAEVKQNGKYLVALQSSGNEDFKMGPNKVPYERNSATYYILDQTTGKDTKMTVHSKGEKNKTHQNTEMKIFDGKALVAHFAVSDAYIDTANVAELAKIVNGAYPQEKYSAYSPLTEKLFLDWFHSDETVQVIEQKKQKHLQAEQRELKRDLQMAEDFVINFTDGAFPTNKLAQLRHKMSQSQPAKLLGKLVGKDIEKTPIKKDLKILERIVSNAVLGKDKD